MKVEEYMNSRLKKNEGNDSLVIEKLEAGDYLLRVRPIMKNILISVEKDAKRWSYDPSSIITKTSLHEMQDLIPQKECPATLESTKVESSKLKIRLRLRDSQKSLKLKLHVIAF
jgi:hypothetical protein